MSFVIKGKSETENTCWRGHVSASLHMKWFYHKGNAFDLCCFVLVSCLCGFRQAHASGRGLEGGEKAKAEHAGKRKSLKKKKKGRIGKGVILLPHSHPWLRFPVNAETDVAVPGVMEIQILSFCFWISSKGGRVLQKYFFKSR